MANEATTVQSDPERITVFLNPEFYDGRHDPDRGENSIRRRDPISHVCVIKSPVDSRIAMCQPTESTPAITYMTYDHEEPAVKTTGCTTLRGAIEKEPYLRFKSPSGVELCCLQEHRPINSAQVDNPNIRLTAFTYAVEPATSTNDNLIKKPNIKNANPHEYVGNVTILNKLEPAEYYIDDSFNFSPFRVRVAQGNATQELIMVFPSSAQHASDAPLSELVPNKAFKISFELQGKVIK